MHGFSLLAVKPVSLPYLFVAAQLYHNGGMSSARVWIACLKVDLRKVHYTSMNKINMLTDLERESVRRDY